jgi:molybdopterin-biosynthesis enzyme MoeA-like protein
VFSFGGVGATPDDHTRQAAAAALGVPLVRHPDAVAEIEARFGAEAYPHRVLMAEFPQGSTIIPNPFNRIASFSVRDHHFFPGFPQMAWPMLEWVLSTRYPDLSQPPVAERAIAVFDAGESQLLPLMDENVARFPALKLFSLPTFLPDGGRRIELGVRGAPALVDEALAHLVAGVRAAGFRFEIVAADAPSAE